MDKAREKTDKRLASMERKMQKEYRTFPALKAAEKKYLAYMKEVQQQTQEEYEAYSKATGEDRRELKQAYTDAVKKLTINSKEYKKVLDGFIDALTKANQAALSIANDEMVGIYADNYNQIADQCRKFGIKVNGSKKQS